MRVKLLDHDLNLVSGRFYFYFQFLVIGNASLDSEENIYFCHWECLLRL